VALILKCPVCGKTLRERELRPKFVCPGCATPLRSNVNYIAFWVVLFTGFAALPFVENLIYYLGAIMLITLAAYLVARRFYWVHTS
jgi:hypothetical protein